MRRLMWLSLLVFPAVAGAEGPTASTTVTVEVRRAEILSALNLPHRAQLLRDDGVPPDEVAQALRASQERGVSAHDTSETLDRAHDDASKHGHVDNFGDFVQARLDEGLRGQDLAAAIHAEHEAHGKGKPDHAGGHDGDRGADGDHGKPDGAGKPDRHDDDDDENDDENDDDDDHGRPTGTGAPETHGKPTTPGGGR